MSFFTVSHLRFRAGIFLLMSCLAVPAVYPAADPSDGGSDDAGTGRFASFPFRVSATVRGGYDDNVNVTSTDTDGSLFSNTSLGITYDFGDARTKFNLSGGGGLTYFVDRPGADDEFDVNAYLGLSVSHKATNRLILSATVYATYQVEPEFNFNAGLNRRSGNYFYTNDRFAVTYIWTPRFATTTSYTVGLIRYDDNEIADFENRVEHTFGNEFRFLVLPTTTAVADYRFQLITYDTGLRDSMSHFALAGVDHNFNPRLSTSVRAGAQFRNFDNDALFSSGEDDELKISPYFDATLNYTVGRRTTVSWTNRYSIEEPDVPGSASRDTFRTGFRVKYDITPRISSTAALYYQHDENDGFVAPPVVTPGFSEDIFDLALGVRYAVTKQFGIEVGYNHTQVASDLFLRDYSRNRYYGGVNVSF